MRLFITSIILILVGLCFSTDLPLNLQGKLNDNWSRVDVDPGSVTYMNEDGKKVIVTTVDRVDLFKYAKKDGVTAVETVYVSVYQYKSELDSVLEYVRPLPDTVWATDKDGKIVEEKTHPTIIEKVKAKPKPVVEVK